MSPACEAVTSQRPTPTKVRVEPDTVQMEDAVVVAYVTDSADEAVAARVFVPSARLTVAPVKVIAFAPLTMSKVVDAWSAGKNPVEPA